jgi:hypothetical protein
MTELFERTTRKGYDLFEVASAFQKSVRRGDEETAMYFAVELFESGYDEYLWKRMKIITSEDVGLAEPALPATIGALYAMYVDQKKKKDAANRPERLFLVHAVLLLWPGTEEPACRLDANGILEPSMATRNLPIPTTPRQAQPEGKEARQGNGPLLRRGVVGWRTGRMCPERPP